MSHRSLELFCACSLVLAACGDSGDRGTTGVSGTSITSASGTATAGTMTAGTGSAGTDTTDGSTGNGNSDSTGSNPTTGSDTTNPATSTTDQTTSTTGNTSNSTTTNSTTTNSTTNNTTSTSGPDSDSETGECAAVSETAQNKKQPADILFVIDNSGSMDMEIASVQANMNQFSTKIINSGIDVHVIVISDNSICIGAPLGSGSCPADSKPPTYVRINDGVGSTNGLEKLLDHYPDYAQYLRPDAATHVVVVTDDDSGLGANAFDTAFKALEPGMADYKFHAICGKYSFDSDPLWCLNPQNAICCGFTAAKGEVYLDLIANTGGQWGDLCLQNFTPVFDVLSTQVIMGATLACEWDIPEPMGEPIDFNKVNVEFDDGMPPPVTFGKVNDPADCANVSDGWYYDNPNMPTKIFVCPQTCDKIQGVPNAKINIVFGCETLIAQ